MAKEFKAFIHEWQQLYKVAPEFKVVVADIQTFLTDLRLWLEQVNGHPFRPGRQPAGFGAGDRQ